MKLGLLTAAFPDLSLEEVAAWAASEGFETLEIACWPAAGGERRRYAGVSHIDVESFDADAVRELLETARARDLVARLLPEQPACRRRRAGSRERSPAQGRRCCAGARRADRRHVRGQRQGPPLPGEPRAVRADLAAARRHAEERGVQIAIENCPMIFSCDEWPGGNNLAATPAAWGDMFEAIPSASFGLNLDPSHLVWQMIDYERVVYDFADRIFHVHAKDLEIRARRALPHGVTSLGMGWQMPRLPGPRRGEVGPLPRARSMRSATTRSSRSSTRTVHSRATSSSSSAAS